ncbi:MAG: acyl carrier protein [Clostridia bacterium]|nr:acyl carrier protein [Clostridia bacterium]
MINKIIEIISERTDIPVTAISAETNLLELDIDSLDIINIVMDVEYSFNVKFYDDEIIELRTPTDIEQTIIKRYSENK